MSVWTTRLLLALRNLADGEVLRDCYGIDLGGLAPLEVALADWFDADCPDVVVTHWKAPRSAPCGLDAERAHGVDWTTQMSLDVITCPECWRALDAEISRRAEVTHPRGAR